MTDLTGAELDLAVARVMGKDPLMLEIGEVDSYGKPVGWRPNQGGAAAWEVLEWVRGQEYEVTFATYDDGPAAPRWCSIDVWEGKVGTGWGAYGPTDAIALCRAVVALGEAG